MENNTTTTTTTAATDRADKLRDLITCMDRLNSSRVETAVSSLAAILTGTMLEELQILSAPIIDREAYRQRITYRLELVRMIQTSGPALSALNGTARGDRTPALVNFMHEILAAERLTPWHAAYDCQHAETCAQ